jgi:hypothetical protein
MGPHPSKIAPALLGAAAIAALALAGGLGGAQTLATFLDAASASAAPRAGQKAPAQADHPPVSPPASAEKESWSDAEIISALEECVGLLAPTGVEIEVSKPIRNGQCGTPAPVILKRTAGVELSPPAVVNCRVAAKVHRWIEETVQPKAREMLGTTVRRIVTASSYMCRQRIGSSTGRVSEHSFANALDIAAFVTADGRSIDVLTNWGETARDRHAKATLGHAGDARSVRDTEPSDRSATTEAQFLRRMHEGACAMFGTVLGPEANEAHRNHLHFDLAQRRRSAFCE